MAVTQAQTKREWKNSNERWLRRWQYIEDNLNHPAFVMRVDEQFVKTALRYAKPAVAKLLVEPGTMLGMLLPYFVNAMRDAEQWTAFEAYRDFSNFAAMAELAGVNVFICDKLESCDGLTTYPEEILECMQKLTSDLVRQGRLADEVHGVIDVIAEMTKGGLYA